jgi:cysteinyl-tRNA synthetase
MHNNMITINGQKMGRSLGNFITLNQFFTGTHEMLHREYHPMTIRLFILQAHYRSTLDFSNEALEASEKGLMRLLKAMDELNSIQSGSKSSVDVTHLKESCVKAMDDDLNTPVLIAHLFDGVKWINGLSEGRHSISSQDLESLKKLYNLFVYEVLGLNRTEKEDPGKGLVNDLVHMVLRLRNDAKANRDYEMADRIRDGLASLGITVKDTRNGADWEIN